MCFVIDILSERRNMDFYKNNHLLMLFSMESYFSNSLKFELFLWNEVIAIVISNKNCKIQKILIFLLNIFIFFSSVLNNRNETVKNVKKSQATKMYLG